MCICLTFLFFYDFLTVEAASLEKGNQDIFIITENEAKNILEENSINNGVSLFSLSNTSIKLTKKDDKLYVAWTVKSTSTATEIGISSLKLQVYSGGTWKDLKSGNYSVTNKMAYTSGYYYTGAKAGSKYRVTGTAYTIINGTKKTSNVKSSEFTY